MEKKLEISIQARGYDDDSDWNRKRNGTRRQWESDSEQVRKIKGK